MEINLVNKLQLPTNSENYIKKSLRILKKWNRSETLSTCSSRTSISRLNFMLLISDRFLINDVSSSHYFLELMIVHESILLCLPVQIYGIILSEFRSEFSLRVHFSDDYNVRFAY